MIVDDEKDLVHGLEMSFKKEGYQVFKAFDGATALKIAFAENPHLVLLDVMLPGTSGLDVCRAIRQRELDTRIIMFSAKTDEVDRIVGLEMGADDYVNKPFSLRELVALIRARLRYRAPGACASVSEYGFGDVHLDFDKQIATKDGAAVELTSKEFDIMHMLTRFRGQVVSRDKILEKIWGHDSYVTARTVDNHILHLRQKLEEDPAKPKFILSVYGGGYKFVG